MSNETNNEISRVVEDGLDDMKGRFLTFYVDDAIYGIELYYIADIVNIQPITPVPGLPYYYKGIINLRGKVAPVIDVRLKFGQEERPYDARTCILVVEISDMQVGLVVDRVAEVVTIDSENRNPPPDLGMRNEERYLSSIANIGGKVILAIDCDKFFQNDRRPN